MPEQTQLERLNDARDDIAGNRAMFAPLPREVMLTIVDILNDVYIAVQELRAERETSD